MGYAWDTSCWTKCGIFGLVKCEVYLVKCTTLITVRIECFLLLFYYFKHSFHKGSVRLNACGSGLTTLRTAFKSAPRPWKLFAGGAVAEWAAHCWIFPKDSLTTSSQMPESPTTSSPEDCVCFVYWTADGIIHCRL